MYELRPLLLSYSVASPLENTYFGSMIDMHSKSYVSFVLVIM